MSMLFSSLRHSMVISIFVFMMMMFVDYLNVLSRGGISNFIKGSMFRQYVATSFLGSTPGCLGAFASVSFYIRGLISLGALAGCMVATSGDESFVMLAMFPKKAIFLFVVLFILGIITSFAADKLFGLFKIKHSSSCVEGGLHKEDDCRCFSFREILYNLRNISFVRFLLLFILLSFLYGFLSGIIPTDEKWIRFTFIGLLFLSVFIVVSSPAHYLQEHIWGHIFKKHMGRIFLWTFGALFLVGIGLRFFDLKDFIGSHMLWVLFFSALVGLIPESGPHLMFVAMFSQGMIPFSVLLTSSIVQDGHGMLPLFSYSFKDSLKVKTVNMAVGLLSGVTLYLFGY